MADVCTGHVTTNQQRIQVVRTDCRVEHGSATTRPDDPEITWTRRFTIDVGKEDEPQKHAKKEKHHLFPLLYLSFVSLSFLTESPLFVNPFHQYLKGFREMDSHFDLQQPRGILVIHLLEDLIRQPQAINSPPPLRGHLRRRVVE